MRYNHYFIILSFITVTAVFCVFNSSPTFSQLDSTTKQLFDAIDKNNPTLVSLLIQKGALVNVCSEGGRTPLMIACTNGYDPELLPKSMPGCLHEESKDASWRLDYDKLLKDRHNIISLLLEAGAQVNFQDHEGMTALHLACILNNYLDPKRVSLLIDAGADCNLQTNYGRTAIMEAVIDGEKEIVDLLLQANANLNLSDNDGMTALKFAVQYDWHEITDSLLTCGAN